MTGRYNVLLLTAIILLAVHLPMRTVVGAEQFTVDISSDEVFYNATEGYYRLTISPDAKTSFLLRVRNLSPYTQQFNALISGVPEGWRVMFENQQTETSFSLTNQSTGSYLILVIPSYPAVANVTISVNSLTFSVTESVMLRIFCEEPAIEFSTPQGPINAPLGKTAEVSFSITNNLEEEIYLNLSLDGVLEGSRGSPDDWVGFLEEKEVHLNPYERRDLNVTIFVPKNATVNQPHIFSIVALAPQKSALYRSQPIKINPQPFYSLISEYVGEEVTTFPGEIINFTIRVSNLAEVEDTFTASIRSLPQGWRVECLNTLNPLNVPVRLSPGERMLLYFQAELPVKTVAGRYIVEIEFTGEGNVTTSSIPVNVLEQVDVVLHYGPGFVGVEGGYYPIYINGNTLPTLLENRGNTREPVEVDIISFPVGWAVHFDSLKWGGGGGERVVNTTTLNMSELGEGTYLLNTKPVSLMVEVPPYVTSTLNLYIEAPRGTPPGFYTISLKASYLEGKRVQVLPIKVKLILAQVVFEDMNGDGRPDILVEPSNKTFHQGDWVTFLCKLKNVYPYPVENLTLHLDIGDNPRVKSVHIDHMEPGEERVVRFRWRAVRGVYAVRIYAEGGGLMEGEEPQVFLKGIEIKEASGTSWGLTLSAILIVSGLLLLLFFFYLSRMERKAYEERRAREHRERYRKVYGGAAGGVVMEGRGKKKGRDGKKKQITEEE